MTSRRGFLLGIGAALAAPAVVRAESLMKIAALRDSVVNLNAETLCRAFQDFRKDGITVHYDWVAICVRCAPDGSMYAQSISREEFYLAAPQCGVPQ